MAWPATLPIATERLRLEPLTVKHAEVMVEVLADGALYEYTGGEAPTLLELRQRYRAQTEGSSPDQSQWWLNWIVTLTDTARPVGYVQATVETTPIGLQASLAWVVNPEFQNRGLATEAAGAMVVWLGTNGVAHFVADIHSGHTASKAVAQRLGLYPTSVVEDDEVRWCSRCHPQSDESGCG